jgi:hypothetical protein
MFSLVRRVPRHNPFVLTLVDPPCHASRARIFFMADDEKPWFAPGHLGSVQGTGCTPSRIYGGGRGVG